MNIINPFWQHEPFGNIIICESAMSVARALKAKERSRIPKCQNGGWPRIALLQEPQKGNHGILPLLHFCIVCMIWHPVIGGWATCHLPSCPHVA